MWVVNSIILTAPPLVTMMVAERGAQRHPKQQRGRDNERTTAEEKRQASHVGGR